jgi:putative permease
MPGIQTRNRIHLGALFSAVLLLLVILHAGRVAEIVIIAALFAYVLDPLVTAIEGKGVSRGVAASLVMLLITSVVVVCWYTVVPTAIDQFLALQNGTGETPASKAMARLDGIIRERCDALGLERFDLIGEIRAYKNSLVQRIPNFLIKDSPSLLLALLMIPFLMFFFLKDVRSMKRYFIALVPNRYFEFTLDLLYKMDLQLGNYLRGQFIDALVFGTLATAALWILSVPYFVFIGIFAGLANLIPFVGPLVGAVVAMTVTVLEQGDIARAGYVLGAFALLKLIDDFVVQPLAVGKNVHLHPMVVAMGIVIGGHLFGVLGMLIVIPLIGFLKVVLEESIDTCRKYRFD